MVMENPRVMKTSQEQEHTLSYKNNSHQQPQKPNIRVLDVSADEDTEISIFDAKRYFNESNNDTRLCKRVSPLNIPNPARVPSEAEADNSALAGRYSSASSAADGYGTYGRNFRVRSFHATPTPSSEASWNSQTGLLSRPTGAISVSMTTTTDDKRKGSGKTRWLWLRRCPCSGKKSVQVEPKTTLTLNQTHKANDDQNRKDITLTSEENHEFHSSLGQRLVATTTTTTATTARVPLMISNGSGTGGFTFPILDQQQPKSSHVKMSMNINTSTSLDDLPRESLEVFVPPGNVTKKLVSRIITQDDDAASDTSSDLFEIESLSTTTQTHSQTTSYPMYNRRDSLDEALNIRSIAAAAACKGGSGFGGCSYSQMMTDCYEPSEASIEWSVTTAEGFERASVGVSEAAEDMHFNHNYNGNGNGNGYGYGKRRSESGGLLSCRSEKAVSVGPNPVKYMPPRGQAAITMKHVGNVNRLSLPFSA